MDKIDFRIMDCEANLENIKGKLKNEIKYMVRTLQGELELLEKENYEPSNSVGVIQANGTWIDNLIGQVTGLNKAIESLKSLKEE